MKQTVTCTGNFELKPSRAKVTAKNRIAYALRLIAWFIKHRNEANCRQKWRRMERDLMTLAFLIGALFLASIDWTVTWP